MLIKTQAIVLSVLKYNDMDAIVKTYTQKSGFVSFFVKSFYKKQKRNAKKSLLQPNSIVKIVATQHKNDGLEYIKEIANAYFYQNLYTDFDKLNQTTFLREILLNILQNESHPDEDLFSYIIESFISLDQNQPDPDFHLKFLLKLTEFLGFLPDYYSLGKFFNLNEGIFTSEYNLNRIFFDINQTKLFKKGLGMIFASEKSIKLTNFERSNILKMILLYYRTHLENFKEPKSLQILNDLYAND